MTEMPTEDDNIDKIVLTPERVALGVLAIMVCNFAYVLFLIALAPIFLFPGIRLAEALQMTPNSNLTDNQIIYFCGFLQFLFFLIFLSPIRLLIWGIKNLLLPTSPWFWIFILLWVIWDLAALAGGMDIFGYHHVVPLLCVAVVVFYRKKIFVKRE